MSKKIKIPEERLRSLYLDKHTSPKKIAKIYNCSSTTVLARMRDFNIPFRSNSEARMRYRKFDFSGDLVEKAYVTGFRLGDLNVYQTNIKSDLVVVRCHTTQVVQVELMKDLFSKYGRINISRSKYGMHINCYLNTTFKFLLPKYKRVPSWIKNSKETILAFIAGYTDAEGNFILNQNRARFKIDSYDLRILNWIKNALQPQGIRVKFRCIAKKGDLQSERLKYNSDLWRININDALSLRIFIKNMKPFIKHKTRLKHMIICEENINQRIIGKTIKYVSN